MPTLEDRANDCAVIRTSLETRGHFPDDTKLWSELEPMVEQARTLLVYGATTARKALTDASGPRSQAARQALDALLAAAEDPANYTELAVFDSQVYPRFQAAVTALRGLDPPYTPGGMDQ